MMQRLSITRYGLTEIINDRGYESGAEIGLDHGYFSYYLLKHSSLRLLYSIDSFAGKWAALEPEVRSMLGEFGVRSRIVVASSAAAATEFMKVGQRFDFVYIDANHRYSAVKLDLQSYWPLINPGGMMAGHDYIVADGCGVIRAVDEFAREHGLELHVTREPWASWIIEKPRGSN